MLRPEALEARGTDALLLDRAALERGVAERPALITAGSELCWADVAERVSTAAAAIAGMGLTAQEALAFRAVSSPEGYIATLACIQLGVPLLPVHPRFTPSEVTALLTAARVRFLPDEQVIDLARGRQAPRLPRDAGIDGRAVLALVPTSGTTGHPKIAALGRAAFVASAAASAKNLGWRADDRWLCCLPLAHVGGLSIITRCAIARRTMILEPRFDAEAVLTSIVAHRATLLSVVPTQLRALLDADAIGGLPRLRAILVGGAACPLPWLSEAAERGIGVLTTYGLTEGCSQLTAQRPTPGTEPPRAEAGCGTPLAGVELRVAGEDGQALAAGAHGRILFRGPMRMHGYLGAPALAATDWLDTGDHGFCDERGALFVEARRTDLVVTGGENVYPAEVERAIEACTGVKRGLVFGIPDDRWGQLVAVLLEVDDPEGFDQDRFADESASRLAMHKRPRRFAVVERLPQTPAGKLDRRAADRFAGALRPVARR